ncbi:MAG: hypothetical protein M0Z99_23265 [Betaproteobacteria bacterium]|nr:hypothetical protein [Betaproteobacteria bacterium]
MIAECTNDLFTKISAIPALAQSTGLMVGGQAPDAGMANVPLPAAWILPAKFQNKTADLEMNRPPQIINGVGTYAVELLVPFKSQSDLITNQLPLLEEVITAVHGTDSPSGQRWWLATFMLGAIETKYLAFNINFCTWQSLFSAAQL